MSGCSATKDNSYRMLNHGNQSHRGEIRRGILEYEKGGADNYIKEMSAAYREEELRLLEGRRTVTAKKPKQPKRQLTYDDDIY